MRGLAGLAPLLLVVLLPGASAQSTSAFVVELGDPVPDKPWLESQDRIPVETVHAFNVTATVRVPQGSVCLGHALVEFSPGPLPAGLSVMAEPTRLELDLSGSSSPASVEADARRVTTRLKVLFAPDAPAFEPHTFRLTASVRAAGDLPCNVEPATDTRYVTWVPEFHPEFTLEQLPRVSDADPPRLKVVNLANADARFLLSYGRSGGEWAQANESFRLEPASEPTDLDRIAIRLEGDELPPGFDGRVLVLQRAADHAFPDSPILTQEIQVASDIAAARLQAYAREEAPGLPVAAILAGVALAAATGRRRGAL